MDTPNGEWLSKYDLRLVLPPSLHQRYQNILLKTTNCGNLWSEGCIGHSQKLKNSKTDALWFLGTLIEYKKIGVSENSENTA